ncbi:DUF4280 domain-containing protein [Corallococcus sp. CA053C]|uniref:DUF4280 domain-containing protein n=1 Tax=Corallococcus sp. CA053C TaxID=2316732 RepID=UPI000EA40AB4|nr:DUF4280 domain-containing protein [Corallococcus sp. CA053C]RKH10772.1 DUF4280 domain-containing protein [Corallococcus sp. CA053C]
MGIQVAAGATLMCTFGVAPSTLVVLPKNKVMATTPAANVMDILPANIPPFGMCQSMSNPTVAAATAAMMGALTPMPCMPLVAGPWAPGSTKVFIAGSPALENGSQCKCMWGGAITVSVAGQTKVQVK